MKLTDEMRAAIANAEGSTGWELENTIFTAGYRMGQQAMRERAAKVADEFDFGLDSQAGLVRDLQSIPIEE